MTKLVEQPAQKTPQLSRRESDALRLARELARAERMLPKPAPQPPQRGNRYIVGQ